VLGQCWKRSIDGIMVERWALDRSGDFADGLVPLADLRDAARFNQTELDAVPPKALAQSAQMLEYPAASIGRLTAHRHRRYEAS
jgi:hypothetical protein